MDPLSITTGCISLLTGISKLSVDISSFVSSVRNARKDMDAVSRELTSLSLCVQTLRDDSSKTTYLDGLRDNILAVLKNCDAVTGEIKALLDRLSSANALRRLQWTATGRGEMNKLRSSLESHKSALEIAVDMTSLILISGVKDDTTQIRQDTSQIDMLVQQIEDLRIQLGASPMEDARAQLLQRFLDQSSTYAETVVDPTEDAWEDSTQATVADQKDPVTTISARSGERESKPIFYCLPPDLSSPRLYQASAKDQKSIDEAALRRTGLSWRERQRLNDKVQVAIMGRKERWKPSGRKNLAEIEKLLDQGADPTAVSGYVPGSIEHWDKLLLSRGVIYFFRYDDWVYGNDKLAKYLRNGARVAAVAAEECFIHAIHKGQKPLVRLFLDAGMSPDASMRSSRSGICTACTAGHPEIVKMLLRAGSRHENDALCSAVGHGNEEIVNILLDHGTSAHSRLENHYKAGQTALETAFKAGKLRIIKTLLNRGAIVYDDIFELTKTNAWGKDSFVIVQRYGKDISFERDGSQAEAVALLTKYYNEQKAAGVKQSFW